jgi:hypothetical protein
MDFRQFISDSMDVLDGEELTGRHAAIIVALWMGATAAFGIVVFLAVFVF